MVGEAGIFVPQEQGAGYGVVGFGEVVSGTCLSLAEVG